MSSAVRRTAARAFTRGVALLFLVPALASAGLGACSGAAAGGDLNSTFLGDPDGSAQGDGSSSGSFPSTLTDSAAADAAPIDAGPVSCTAKKPSSFSPVWRRPTKEAACSADELGGYYDACSPNPKTTSCLAWLTEHSTCGHCIERDDNSGPMQIYLKRMVFTLNVAGCISLVEKANGGDDSCAEPYDAYFQCRRQSCEQCFSVPGATYDDFQKCQTAAATTECKSYQDAEVRACVGVKTAAPACFPTALENAAITGKDPVKAKEAQRSFFLRVERLFCGL